MTKGAIALGRRLRAVGRAGRGLGTTALVARRPRAVALALGVAAVAAGCFPKGWRGRDADFALPVGYPFETGPYLVPLAAGKIAVVVKRDLDVAPVVEWWVGAPEAPAAPSEVHVERAERFEDIWVATMDALPFDVALSYVVKTSSIGVGPFDFKAGASRGAPFRFAAFGDTRTGHDVHRGLIELLSEEPIDFVIHSGDLVEFGGTEEQWDLFFRVEAPVISRRPLLAAIGNHDASPRRYFERYLLSDFVRRGRRYESYDWGDVRVVIADSESECRKGSDQYAFLERALREGAKAEMLMLISLHYPPYSSGAHGSNLEMREVIGDLAPRYGVELVLAGHDHDYERTHVIDGVTYVVAASGGANIRKISPSSFSKVLRTEPHFLLFDVDRGSLVGRAISLSGTTFDSFVIEPNPPRDGR